MQKPMKGVQKLSRKKIADEAVIAALITHPSVREASKACGLSETQIYARMKDPDFSKLYREARRDVLSGCTSALQSRMSQAVEVLAETMSDKKVAPQVRVNAANSIFQHGIRLTEQIDVIERLESLERMMEDQE